MGAPESILGQSWGAPVSAALAALGISCDAWQPWESDPAFAACFAATAVVAFGANATVRAIASAERLEGAQLTFADCAAGWPDVRREVVKAYGLEDSGSGDLYERWSGGEALRLSYDPRDRTCQLTVAGPRLGPAYATAIARAGLGAFSAGMRP